MVGVAGRLMLRVKRSEKWVRVLSVNRDHATEAQPQ